MILVGSGERDGLWVEIYNDPQGTGYVWTKSFFGTALSLALLGRGVTVGWQYRRQLGPIQIDENGDPVEV